MSGASPMSPLTTAGAIIGTIQYMSPEQIEGKEADARSDLFALGAVLYEMVTGGRPFSGKSQISVASAILEKDPEPISTLQPLTPPAFEYVINTCLAKNPEDRFQTAHDVKLQLKWIAQKRDQDRRRSGKKKQDAEARAAACRRRTRDRVDRIPRLVAQFDSRRADHLFFRAASLLPRAMWRCLPTVTR